MYCSGCDQYLELSAFGKDRTNVTGFRSRCNQCRNHQRRENRKKNRQKFLEYENRPKAKLQTRNNTLKRKYKITVEDFDRMLAEQNNVCKLCGQQEKHKSKRNLTVDHCHITGKVRGLLCHRCNCTIGLARENVTVLKKMINYLEVKV